mmetsp:Transcript_39449/g.93466  ORF Transcript_39449/g.93466 Transcript_39449/m.93466 type:complete len:126 (+) Transcript_39449:266-643(+)
MVWPFSRRKKKAEAILLGVDLDSSRRESRITSMPGVGAVDLDCTKKSNHSPSNVVDENGGVCPQTDKRGRQSSTLSPDLAFVHPKSLVAVAELRLSPHKLPVCIIMTEEVESIVWPKHLQGSRRS